MAGGFLLNGNGRRQAFNQIDIGFVHALQKLPRIGRQTFHIAALTFCVQRVKRQTGLARPRQTRDDHQLVARDVDVNVFQIVGAGATNADLTERASACEVVRQVIGVLG